MTHGGPGIVIEFAESVIVRYSQVDAYSLSDIGASKI